MEKQEAETPPEIPAWRRYLFAAGLGCMLISALPWIGLGGYSFVVPGWNIFLPRMHIIYSSELWELLTIPLHYVAMIPPLDDIIYFCGEGRVAVRPFVLSLFYFLLAGGFVWVSMRGSDFRRHCPRFRLRTLLITMLIVGPLAGWGLRRDYNYRRAVEHTMELLDKPEQPSGH